MNYISENTRFHIFNLIFCFDDYANCVFSMSTVRTNRRYVIKSSYVNNIQITHWYALQIQIQQHLFRCRHMEEFISQNLTYLTALYFTLLKQNTMAIPDGKYLDFRLAFFMA